jgi:small subunit ribosomal protein S6
MKKYEALFIIKPDLKDEEKAGVMKALKDQVAKHRGAVLTDQVWAERRRLAYDIFPIGGGTRFKEGMYYLLNFESPTSELAALKAVYGLNENVLRFLILKIDEKAKSN